MNTVLVEKNAIEEVAKLVSDNQVVAFPTETVLVWELNLDHTRL